MSTKFTLKDGKIQKEPLRIYTKYRGSFDRHVTMSFPLGSGWNTLDACARCNTCFRVGLIEFDKGGIGFLADPSLGTAGSDIANVFVNLSQFSFCDGDQFRETEEGNSTEIVVSDSPATKSTNHKYPISDTGGSWVVAWETFTGGAFGSGTIGIINVKKVTDVRCRWYLYRNPLDDFFGTLTAAGALLNAHGCTITVGQAQTGYVAPPSWDGYLVETLIVTQPPATVVAGAAFSVEIITDNPVGASWAANLTTDGIHYDAFIESDPTQAATLGGTTAYVLAPGTDKVFTGLSITKAGKKYRLSMCGHWRALATTFLGHPYPEWVLRNLTRERYVMTDTFDVVAAAADHVTYTHFPSSTLLASEPFGLTVEIRDAYGNLCDTSTANVTISADSHLHGTLTVAAVNGIATFTGLTYDLPVNSVTLTASSSGLTSTTHAQTVHAQLQWTVTPTDVAVGASFNIEVSVRDFVGALVTLPMDQLSLLMYNHGGGTDLTVHLTGSHGPTIPTAGIVNFGSESIDLAGSYDIYALSDGSSYPVAAILAPVVAT